MLNIIYRLILSLNSTSWMVVIYGTKNGWNFIMGSRVLTTIVLLCIPVAVTALSLLLSRWFGLCNDQIAECHSIRLADNEFLPIYLGYFFVALSVPNCYTLIVVYCLLLLFSFLSQTQYFNPIFLLFGFHYYHLDTSVGTQIFIISHGKVIRSVEEVNNYTLRRINDTTFISVKEKLHV